MPMNNNQKGQSAAARLVKLPLVHSACTTLSVFYTATKCSHPSLRSVCEMMESSMTAVVSPVIVKLEPQIFVANHVACRSLDWLETSFPVVHTPTEQIVATAKNKMHQIQDVVSTAAKGSRDCVEDTVAWLTGGIQPVGNHADGSVVERAMRVASVGLDSALIMSEALMDRVLPPTEEDREKEAHLVEGFEAAALRTSYPARLVSLAAKLCRRTYQVVGSRVQCVQVMENLSRSSGLIQDFQTRWQTLPHYLQHQIISALFFISKMYNLGSPPPQRHPSHQDRSCLNAADTSRPHNSVVQVNPQATPICRKRRSTKTPVFDNGCKVKGCVR
ncbi:perilipin-2-like [Centropristis striata]|uniref:perilipin-2-like n=1 Tax=Centropristis striata TaxID=184440 RepID=UPI0027DEBDD6|nr:perilipin-2-like [Centropristis striata]XP_059185248.1 perilipin-2-like [Centropristis striata]XP_059185256.1 perilipin-2-like [Centropristis striata]XP_059185261.1 perilipin-2-like [Centropristis striata]